MTENQQVPTYVYGPDTTLGGLFQAYLTATNTKPAALAKRLGLHDETLGQWLKGIPSDSLTSSHMAKVQAETGIDLDRWMVVEAKRQLLANDPSRSRTVSFDRFVTRREIVEELARYAEMYGDGASIERQIGLKVGSVHRWTKGQRRDLPTDENLCKVIDGLFAGLIKGNRNDVLVRLMARELFGRELAELFPATEGIISLSVAFLKVLLGCVLLAAAAKTFTHKR